MLVCPVCAIGLGAQLSCSGCGWQGLYRDGLPVLLDDADLVDDVARCYTDNYDRIARDDLDAKVLDERYIENLAANLCQSIELKPGDEVGDIGSGKGSLVRKLLQRGAASVTAVDISLPYLARMVGQPRIVPIRANAERLPFADHFDVLVATDVLEHVLNVGAFLYSANRALRSGGRLYLRVPFRENLLQYAPQAGCPYRFVHLRTYDRPLLRQALEEAGFVVEGLWLDGLVRGVPRPVWRRGWLRSKLYSWFEDRLHRSGRNPGDVTLHPHGLRRLFLQPTVVIAAARKVKSLVPAASANRAG